MKFSLFFFSDDETHLDSAHKYKLLLKSAKFADEKGFEAIWVPERHFNSVGGLYPNPSVLGAALAMITKKLRIRAGSVVLPLHNILRVAEEWAVVDNLSGGRVDLAVASGWHINDFVLSSWESHARRKEILFESISHLKSLWRGNPLKIKASKGDLLSIKAHPAPIQKDIHIWISSSSKSPETWIQAGRIGAHVLTALIIQTMDDLKRNIEIYKNTLLENGFDPAQKQITLMLHTFVNENEQETKSQVKAGLVRYIKNHLALYQSTLDSEIRLSEEDKEVLAQHSFEKYYAGFGLLGPRAKCLQIIDQAKQLGVTEIACLIDFGIDHDLVIQNLSNLTELKAQLQS